jgi:hypothetical protein
LKFLSFRAQPFSSPFFLDRRQFPCRLPVKTFCHFFLARVGENCRPSEQSVLIDSEQTTVAFCKIAQGVHADFRFNDFRQPPAGPRGSAGESYQSIT